MGEEYVYIGSSMDKLATALEDNTFALIEEAKTQLASKIKISEVADEMGYSLDQARQFSDEQALEYLMKARVAIAKKGGDLSDLGIAGLTNETVFSQVDEAARLKYAEAIAREAGNGSLYEQDYVDELRRSDITKYAIYNHAMDNARKAVGKDDEAKKYQEALLIQAAQSGGVSETLISAYRKAMKEENEAEIKRLGAIIADSTEKIVAASEGHDSYVELIDRVTKAIEQQRRDQIDVLKEINDSIKTANDELLAKMQEQVDQARQSRKNTRTEQEIQDLLNKRAMLAASSMDQSALLALDKQIAEAEESYQDTLVDQALQNLQDANSRASEQRERQIALLEAQLDQELDSGRIANEAAGIVVSSLEAMKIGTSLDLTEMGKLLFGTEGKGLGDIAKKEFASDLQLAATKVSNWLTNSGEGGGNSYSNDNPPPGANSSIDAAALASANDAVSNAKAAFANTDSGGWNDRGDNSAYKDALKDYQSAIKGASESDFQDAIFGGKGNLDKDAISGTFPNVNSTKGVNPNNRYGGLDRWDRNVRIDLPGYDTVDGLRIDMHSWAEDQDEISALCGGSPQQSYLAMYKGVPYIYSKNGWREFEKNGSYTDLRNAMINYLTGYKFETGGLADFTGPAWLDGTRSKPEYVLSATQTERFFSLVNVLESLDTKKSSTAPSGDNYFDIEIKVEKLENDYDVEKIADKIRNMIYEDATYRNVNAISHIR